MFIKVILGFFQVQSISELAIRIQKHPKQEMFIRTINIMICLINLGALIAMCILGV